MTSDISSARTTRPRDTRRREQAAPSTEPRRRQPSHHRSAQYRRGVPYAFLSPFFVLYALFLLIPTLIALWISLHTWTGIGAMQWVGLDNYVRLFRDTSFQTAALNTFWYVAASVLIIVPISLIIATALAAKGLRARDLFRVAFFIPFILSPVVVALVFTILFDPNAGLVNSLLNSLFGIGPVNWLGDAFWAKVTVIILMVWRYTGYLVIYFLAGLQSIPTELYEAAELDGAGLFAKFRNVTIPMLAPVTAFVAITSFVGAAQIFEEPFILTQGGPGESTLSIAYFIYRAAFTREQLGYAAAASFLLFIVLFIFTRLARQFFGIGREDRA
ncbi:multiple sugar transport system permease protein/cellobiose transport system permease protein/arabinosaccharide transport system permease protein [Curtobacterium sp. PhB130]|uniref:carbohydrate ABC transporter permease n=1 Tax=unclassified Curtobacterium TaxID=257496 RepID=UPI000F4CF26E|nr:MULTISPECIES: sugar ABC transporter permease [unclassified Curtobacterium]ROS71840.1 multiple sugar transport system permease protein/cellobiose transport system permease protein/arabinosaccharide transport system permease protein [Curtobacterium sp. PhB130]TCK58234.1 multiple sugar transport system permease protein/cellobiose transport system permease protein/arabinosaccharide transport system permease protein [Curtobacterium sp. PhB136]